MKRSEALKLRGIIEQAVCSIDDKTASEGTSLFPRLKGDGSLIAAGIRINWNGRIKKAAVDLWDMEVNTPDNSPTLWQDIDYREGIRIIPGIITAAAAFDMDEIGWWGDTKYQSIIPANVYNPEQYPAGWEVV